MGNIMGKVDENKQQKLESLFQSAYDLFLTQGISKTSIHDIVQKAGVAKGTFYLYFRDKYEIRDRLIAKTAGRLFMSAHDALDKAQIPEFEDKIIFIVDYILDEMGKNRAVLRFISKNLSWGIFRQAITKNEADSEMDVMAFFTRMVKENPDVKLKAPETMLFLIIELASSTSYSTILENDPISYEELKPYLNESIRAIIRNHVVE
ncbi:putative transcriptional regulator, TetR family [Clostridium sp. D5]|nr:putative transcriptional regulator, TetR family [Clostridium sp. D5]